MNNRILLVDDEPDILEFLSYNLRKDGFEVFTASGGLDALQMVKAHSPGLVLLDVMMPQMDGITVARELRADHNNDGMLIAMLTARGEDYSQIAGFEAGADDYITKPIRPAVLISRIHALLKRTENKEPTQTETPIFIDRERYQATIHGQQINLPRKEFELLALLLSCPERVFSRDEIFERIWGDEVVVGERTIDVHIRKLREKVGQNYIHTVKGVGYKLTFE